MEMCWGRGWDNKVLQGYKARYKNWNGVYGLSVSSNMLYDLVIYDW